MALSVINGGQNIVDDPRSETQKLRRTDLMRIARSRGIKFEGYPTSDQLLKLFEAEDVTADFAALAEATRAKEDAKLKPLVDIATYTKEFTEQVEKAPWFALMKMAAEYGVEVPEKGTKDRTAVFRAAILKAALDG